MTLSQTFIEAKLSRRQCEVARAILDGLTNQEIGSRLFIAEKTVKHHCTDIFPRLKVHGRRELLQRYGAQREAERTRDTLNELSTKVMDLNEVLTLSPSSTDRRREKAKALRALPRGRMNE